jgi:hypothetical protein
MRWIAPLLLVVIPACGNGLRRASAAANGPGVDTDSVYALVRVPECANSDFLHSIDLRALDTDAPMPFMRLAPTYPVTDPKRPTVCEFGGTWPSLRNGERRFWIQVDLYPPYGRHRRVVLRAPIDPAGRLRHRARDGVQVWTWICRLGQPCTGHPIAREDAE